MVQREPRDPSVGVGGVGVLDRLCGTRMQPLPARRAQRAIERLADQRVGERVDRCFLLLDHEPRPERLLQRADDGVLVDAGHDRQQPERELVAQDGGLCEHAAAGLRQSREAAREHLLDAVGHADPLRG
jgi:hypothetical protein